MILGLERTIKQTKQDSLSFALGHPSIALVIAVFSWRFPVLKNKISIKPTSLSGDHTDNFEEWIDDVFYGLKLLSYVMLSISAKWPQLAGTREPGRELR